MKNGRGISLLDRRALTDQLRLCGEQSSAEKEGCSVSLVAKHATLDTEHNENKADHLTYKHKRSRSRHRDLRLGAWVVAPLFNAYFNDLI